MGTVIYALEAPSNKRSILVDGTRTPVAAARWLCKALDLTAWWHREEIAAIHRAVGAKERAWERVGGAPSLVVITSNPTGISDGDEVVWWTDSEHVALPETDFVPAGVVRKVKGRWTLVETATAK